MFDMSILELVSCLIRDECCTCEDGEITEYFFFLVTESWSLDTENSKDSLELVEDDTCECLSIDVICDDDEFSPPTLSERLENS